MYAFYKGLGEFERFYHPVIEELGILLTLIMLAISLVFFLIATFKQPGYLTKKYDFIWLVDQFLENGIHLDNLCVVDEVIKSP